MSLIEIMITLVIGVILLTFGTSQWQDFIEQSYANTTTNQIVRAINFSRLEAIKQGDTVTLCGSADKKNCDGNWTEGQILKCNNVVQVFEKIPGKGELIWAGFPSKKYLKINPQGFLQTQNGTFVYSSKTGNKKYQRNIIVNKSGRVRTEEGL